MAPASWRRLVWPAGVLLVLGLAGAAVANGGAIQQAASSWLGGAAPTATEVATQTATVQPTMAAPTPAPPTSAPSVAATLAPATLAPATDTATLPATATRPSTPTLPPSATPTVLPPGVVRVATVVLPNGLVGRLRDAPNGQLIGGVPGNIQVYVLSGRQTTTDNIVWVRIRLPKTGQTGWFAESLLQYAATAVP